MSESLKPCPHCGGAARHSGLAGKPPFCLNACLEVALDPVAAWNRRASPASPAIVDAERRVIEIAGEIVESKKAMVGAGVRLSGKSLRLIGAYAALAALRGKKP